MWFARIYVAAMTWILISIPVIATIKIGVSGSDFIICLSLIIPVTAVMIALNILVWSEE